MKKTNKRNKRNTKRAVAIPRMANGLGAPKAIVRTLNYSENISMASTLGILNEYLFRANSVYDPNYTGIGHQPYMFDQCAAFFNHYDVLSSTIKITVVPTISNPGVAIVSGVYLADDTSAYTDYGTFIEARRGTYKIIPAAANNTAPVSIKTAFNKKSFYSKSVDQGETTALISANPTEDAFFHIWMQSADKASTSNAVQYNVELTYTVRFFEPKDIPSS